MEIQIRRICKRRRRRPRVKTRLERQRPRRNLFAEFAAWLQKQKVDRRSRTKFTERSRSKKALRSEDSRARREKRGFSADPHRFKIPAKFEGMVAVNVRKIFPALEMLLPIKVDAARESSGIQEIRHDDGRFKSLADRIHLESSLREIK